MPIELLSGTECYRSFSEWQEVEENQQDRLKEQWLLGQSISKSTRNYSDQVRCSLCLQTFQLSQTKTPSDSDLRENLHCPGCQINSRGRAALTLLLAERTNEHSIYLTEQLSSAFRFVRDKFANCMGSEYCEDENRLGKMRLQLRSICPGTELRIEDVTALQMDDDSVDAIGSFDVLEHVPDYRAGLREFHRAQSSAPVMTRAANECTTCPRSFMETRSGARPCVTTTSPGIY